MSNIIDKLTKEFQDFIGKAVLNIIKGQKIFVTIDDIKITFVVENVEEIKK